MELKFLRFVGAIVVAILFAFLVNMIHLSFFVGAVHTISNLSWSNWLGFDTFRGFLLPIAWAILWAVAWGLSWLVRGNRWIAALPVVVFVSSIIKEFGLLFLHPLEEVYVEAGQGFWYYLGAIITYIAMLICYTLCTVFMLSWKEESSM